MKNIAICCDGTGNEYGPNNTNVVKLYQSVVRDAEQIAFYDPGVHSDVGGSYAETGISDIALKWMLENAQKRGLRLKEGWADKFNPDPSGLIHESRTGLWRVWRPAGRHILVGAKIHKSVFDRINDSQTNFDQPGNSLGSMSQTDCWHDDPVQQCELAASAETSCQVAG